MSSFTRLKRVATLRAGGTPSVDDPVNWSDDDSDGTPWVSISDMSDGSEVTSTSRCVTCEGLSSRRLPVGAPGTLLFAMYASVGAVAELGTRATWNQALLGITPRDGLSHQRFIRYWLEHLRTDLGALVRSNTQDNLNAEQVGNFPFPTFPVSAQQAIADYLDTETARIDALIAKKQRMIELHAYQREVLTAAGVTGADGARERRASGVPWITEIPALWRTAKLTLVATLGSGHTPSRSHPEWWVNCTIPWVTTGEVAAMRTDRLEYVSETREKISAVGMANSAATLHPAGTVVLCRTASAGYSAIMASDMATSQDFATWTCGPLLRPRYLLLCLRAMRSDLLGRLAMGSTHKTIYMPDIESLRIPLPPVEEQDEIAESTWQKLSQIDAIVDKLTAQIKLLSEHRQALITAAVTGESEVPGVVA